MRYTSGRAKPQKLDAVFYKSQSGTEPVRDWPKRLPKDARKAIFDAIA